MRADITFRKTKVEDLDLIDLHPVFDGDPHCVQTAKNYVRAPNSIAYTLLSPTGQPIAVAGGFFLYGKVMEIWTIVDKSVIKIPKYYSKAMKFLLEKMFSVLKVDRMQVHIKASEKWALSWAKFLGFEKEGLLRKYGSEGVDYYLFAKVRG